VGKLTRANSQIHAAPFAQKSHDLGQTYAAPKGLLAHARSEFRRAFEAAHISRGSVVADRPAFLIGFGLSENSSQFDFARFGGSVFLFACPSGQFLGNHRHACTVNFHIENWDGFATFFRALRQLRRHGRSHSIHQTLDLAPLNAQARLSQKVLTGRFVSLLGGGARAQAGHGRRETLHQTQGAFQRTASGLGFWTIIVIAPHFNDAKESANVPASEGMAFFTGFAGVLRDAEAFLIVQALQELATVLEQGFAQTEFDGFHVGHALALQALGNQIQEGGRFPEAFVGDLLWLEFFLLSAPLDSSRVISSLRVTYSSAKAWKRR
jgi:hypothetical protein